MRIVEIVSSVFRKSIRTAQVPETSNPSIVDELEIGNAKTKKEVQSILVDKRKKYIYRQNAANEESADKAKRYIRIIGDFESLLACIDDNIDDIRLFIRTYGYFVEKSESNKDIIKQAVKGSGEAAHALSEMLFADGLRPMAHEWDEWAMSHGYSLGSKVKKKKETGYSSTRGGQRDHNGDGKDNKNWKADYSKLLKPATIVVGAIVILAVVIMCIEKRGSKAKELADEKLANETTGATSSNLIDDTTETDNLSAELEQETVEEETTEEPEEPKTVALSELRPFSASNGMRGFKIYESVKDAKGKEYTYGIGGIAGDKTNWETYKLDGEYEYLEGWVILNYDYRGNHFDTTYVKIYTDDVLVYTSPLVSDGMESDKFSIDISNTKSLKVSIEGMNNIRIADAYLYEEKNDAENNDDTSSDVAADGCVSCFLSDIDWINSSDNSGGICQIEGKTTDNFGNHYTNSYKGSSGVDLNWSEYNIEHRFSKMYGRVVLNEEYKDGENKEADVKIYGDQEKIYESPIVTKGMEPDDFCLDVSNVSVLRIEITGTNYVRLVDPYFCVLGDEEPLSTCEKYKYPNQIYLGDATWYDASVGFWGTGFRTGKSAKDNQGNNYSNAVYGSSEGENWCKYRLNGQMSNIVGRVILNGDYADKEYNNSYVKIYCDDNLVFQSAPVTRGYVGEDFNIELSEVDDLMICIDGKDNINIVDCYINK